MYSQEETPLDMLGVMHFCFKTHMSRDPLLTLSSAIHSHGIHSTPLNPSQSQFDASESEKPTHSRYDPRYDPKRKTEGMETEIWRVVMILFFEIPCRGHGEAYLGLSYLRGGQLHPQSTHMVLLSTTRLEKMDISMSYAFTFQISAEYGKGFRCWNREMPGHHAFDCLQWHCILR